MWVLTIPRPAFSATQAMVRSSSKPVTARHAMLPLDSRTGCVWEVGLALGSPSGTFSPPNISPDPRDDIVKMLTDGHAPQLRRIGLSMADVVTNSASLPLPDREARALICCLRQLAIHPTR